MRIRGFYTLSLHDALPIYELADHHPPLEHHVHLVAVVPLAEEHLVRADGNEIDRKSTRLNSSHVRTSYAVFCLKKKTRQPAQLVNAQQRYIEVVARESELV